MTQSLELTDIQGNIVRAYGKAAYLFARYVFLEITDADAARAFLGKLIPRVTTGIYADSRQYSLDMLPMATTNIAFTFAGLRAIEVPDASLMGFPQEFASGMRKRRAILGDDGPSDPQRWDPVWQKTIHLWVSINGRTDEAVEERYQWLTGLVDETGGVTIQIGHRGPDGRDDLPYQSATVLRDDQGQPMSTEHFRFTDGIGDPVFEGQPNAPQAVLGRGKLLRDGSWAPLATGEFLLGHLDEAIEYPKAPAPRTLSRNGTYMVYRKLHENVATFNRFLDEQAALFDGSKEMLAAKWAGRWRDNGAPVVNAPDDAAKARWDNAFNAADAATRKRMLIDFTFNDDLDGAKCPLSSHIRRINPRGSLEFGVTDAFNTPGALVDRRRIMRRGLPYGHWEPGSGDDGDHGIVFMALNASIKRQFEFIQQQWVNYGNDFKEGNDREILLGNHPESRTGKIVIPAPSGTGKPPHFVAGIPRLVETRGGDYFFIPSLTALRMIAAGVVDPT